MGVNSFSPFERVLCSGKSKKNTKTVSVQIPGVNGLSKCFGLSSTFSFHVQPTDVTGQSESSMVFGVDIHPGLLYGLYVPDWQNLMHHLHHLRSH